MSTLYEVQTITLRNSYDLGIVPSIRAINESRSLIKQLQKETKSKTVQRMSMDILRCHIGD